MFRTLRVLRPLRSLNAIPRLKSLVSAMISSVPQIVNATIVIFFMFIIFGILMLQVHMQNLRERERERERKSFIYYFHVFYYDLFLPYFGRHLFYVKLFSGKNSFRCRYTSFPVHLNGMTPTDYIAESMEYAHSGIASHALMQLVGNRSAHPFCGALGESATLPTIYRDESECNFFLMNYD